LAAPNADTMIVILVVYTNHEAVDKAIASRGLIL